MQPVLQRNINARPKNTVSGKWGMPGLHGYIQHFVSVISFWEQVILRCWWWFHLLLQGALRTCISLHWFQKSRGIFIPVAQRADHITPASTFSVPVHCLLHLSQVRSYLQLFSQFILPKIVVKIIEVISASEGKKRGGREEEEDGNKAGVWISQGYNSHSFFLLDQK